jgi:hypothetical protein
MKKIFVHFLYQIPAFDAFDDFNDFLESITCGTSKSCQVHVVRIHAGEPTFRFNNIEVPQRLFVQILYASVKADVHNLLNLNSRSDEHGFEKCKSMLHQSVPTAKSARACFFPVVSI